MPGDLPAVSPGDIITLRTGEVLTVVHVDYPLILGKDGHGEDFMTTESAVAAIELAKC